MVLNGFPVGNKVGYTPTIQEKTQIQVFEPLNQKATQGNSAVTTIKHDSDLGGMPNRKLSVGDRDGCRLKNQENINAHGFMETDTSLRGVVKGILIPTTSWMNLVTAVVIAYRFPF